VEKILTIITINRNDSKGLARTIQSILPLLDGSVEYVVVDGLSSDDSMKVAVSMLTGVRGVKLISESDDGIYDAMNKGWKFARGSFVAFVNSGDEIIVEAYRRFLIWALAQHADVIYAKTLLVGRNGSNTVEHVRHPDQLAKDTIPHPSTILRRDVMDAHCGYDERWKIVSDRDLFIRIKRSGGAFAYFPCVVTRFYLGGASSTWRGALESARLSYIHGYIGPTAWCLRYVCFGLLRISPRSIELVLPSGSSRRLLIDFLARKIRKILGILS
jgi:glycosyltransferase involved in cell wall biosynthesis